MWSCTVSIVYNYVPFFVSTYNSGQKYKPRLSMFLFNSCQCDMLFRRERYVATFCASAVKAIVPIIVLLLFFLIRVCYRQHATREGGELK